MGKIDLYAQLADIKDINYKNTLAIATLIELLVDKGILDKREFSKKARELENATLSEINNLKVKKRAHR